VDSKKWLNSVIISLFGAVVYRCDATTFKEERRADGPARNNLPAGAGVDACSSVLGGAGDQTKNSNGFVKIKAEMAPVSFSRRSQPVNLPEN